MSVAMSGAEAEAGRVEREAAIWAIRLFIGREPTSEAEIEFHRGHPNLESIRRGFALTSEFQDYYASLTPPPPYAAPLFLLEPSPPTVPQLFTPPSLLRPMSQLCTVGQMEEPAYAAWCNALHLSTAHHRKIWEFCYILAVAETQGMLRPGMSALGFGVGTEPLPAFLASRGLTVVATDAPPEAIEGHGWDTTNQHAAGLAPLRRPDLVDDATFEQRVSFRPADMNVIPPDLQGFDFCWSSCCFEHLGSIENGLRFVQRSLETLRPGGLAVHTTEFNLGSNDRTIEVPTLSLFRKQDMERLMERLAAAGHEPLPLNLHPGSGKVDEYIDLPPYALPHLKLQVGGQVTTSIGVAVRKKG